MTVGSLNVFVGFKGSFVVVERRKKEEKEGRGNRDNEKERSRVERTAEPLAPFDEVGVG
jgi:hypothetical protein